LFDPVVRRRLVGMLRLLALLLSTASATRLSAFWRLKAADLTAGDVVIPTMARRWEDRAAFRAARERMFAAGLYPGVDYAIEEAAIAPDARGRAEEERLSLTVRPIYPLIPKLEREWPITVPYEMAPRWMSPTSYNLLTAGFTLGLAAAGLLTAAVLASAVTLSVVPSLSMTPTIMPRDVLLVEKLSPRLGAAPHRGDLVFFQPPPRLREIADGRRVAAGQAVLDTGTLFVKRIVAVPGDTVSTDANGATHVLAPESPLMRAGVVLNAPPLPADSPLAPLVRAAPPRILAPGEYWVLGDNADVSVDSRCWGELAAGELVGRPLVRVLPLSRFGAVE